MVSTAELMFRTIRSYIWGIVVNDDLANEGSDIGTGVGILWGGRDIIITADHVISGTPLHRVGFFVPPQQAVSFGSLEEATPATMTNRRRSLEGGSVFSDESLDLAAILLPEQPNGTRMLNFFRLVDAAESSEIGTQVAVAGYPKELRRPVGDTWGAVPYVDVGLREKDTVIDFQSGEDFVSGRDLIVSYPSGKEIWSGGNSGGGVWSLDPNESILGDGLRLSGIVVRGIRNRPYLVARKIEAVISFLRAKLP